MKRIALVVILALALACDLAGPGTVTQNSSSQELARFKRAPGAFSITSAEAGDRQVILSWSSSTYANGYRVSYSTSSGVYINISSADATAPFTVSGLTNGTKYYFMVTAVNANGATNASSEASATPAAPTSPPPPSPPGAFSIASATAGNAQVTLAWGASSGATSYTVKYGIGSTNYPVIASANATSPFTVTGLTNGTKYYFMVTAVSSAGSTNATAEVSATPVAPLPAPGPFNITAATAGNAQVQLTWSASSNASSYTVKYGTSSGSYPTTKSTSATSPYTVTGLTNGTTYYFMVTAVNASGSTNASFEQSAKPTGGTTGLTPSGPITISGQSGTVISGLRITSTTGDCVRILNSTNITIQNSEIGPCSGGSAANGVVISGGNGIHVYDSYIHPETLAPGCCDYHDGILINGGAQNVDIQGNVIAYGESNIEALGVSYVSVIGNFLLNPRGPFPRGQNFQSWSGNSNMTVRNNYALSSTDTTKYLYPEGQEDSINFGVTNTATAEDNLIVGGHSGSGCGLIADAAANGMTFRNNRLLNTGQCGIGIADGTNQLVTGNKIYNWTPVPGGGNTAIYVWKQYTDACGPTTVSNNIADEIKEDGVTHSGYWNGGGCDPVTLSGNTWGAAADSLLTPTSTVFAPPLIPPQPKNCVTRSPYTNQTSLPGCT